MSRLDQHIDAVRTRFLIQGLLNALAWGATVAAGGLLVTVLVCRVCAISLPSTLLLAGIAGVATFTTSLVVAIVRSPSRETTAIKIDEKLQLKERFSTALFAKDSTDEFARAAVRDAQRAAESVSLRRQFPYRFPKGSGYALAAIAALVLADHSMPTYDLFGRTERARQYAANAKQQVEARNAVEKALAEVNAIPKVGAQEKSIAAARAELETLLRQPINDPVEATRSAQKAMQDAQAMRDRMQDAQKSVDAQEQVKAFKSLASERSGGVLEDTRKALSEGKFEQAASKLQDAVKDFNSADPDKQQQTAQDMAKMAEQLKQIATDPKVQQQIQKQLQQAGATPEQAQKIIDEMQKASAGDKDAQQRLQNMAQNMVRTQNGGIPAPQQLAKLLNQMQQMQGQMKSQQAAAQLSQAAQQIASAMKQQAQCGKQGQNGQQQQQAQGQSQKGQGQQQNQQGGSQMADAQQAMQDALDQLEAMRQDAQMADAGESGKNGQDEAEQANNQNGGQGQNGPGQGQGPAGWNQGGQAAGDRNYKSPTPYTVKREVDKGEKDDKGKMQAGWFVKAATVKGESKEQFKQVVINAQREATDDVEVDRIPMQSQDVVRKYFDTMQQDAGTK